MANIRIEEKKSSSLLPILLGLLLLGLLAWAAFTFLGDDIDDEEVVMDREQIEAPVAPMANEVNGAAYAPMVTKFMTYTEEMQGEMGLDHEFSHNAITYLANAVEAVADAHDVEISNNTKSAKQLADEITVDPTATDHADKIRMAAMKITETIEKINKDALDGAANAPVANLRKEAEAINGKTLTLNQKEDVRGFFGAARSVLAAM